MNNLFDGSDESENDLQLGTNKDYAKSYNSFRKKELLKKFKDRGLNASGSSSSSDSDSTEEDEVLDPKFDQDFFTTLASLKSKDPAIYDRNTQFFASSQAEEVDGEANTNDKLPKNKEKSSKPVTLKDYERKILLERDGKFEDESGDEMEELQNRSISPTAVEEENRLKAEFKKVINNEDSDSEEEEFGAIFKKRVKTNAEQVKEDEDFATWLAGKKEDIGADVKEKLEPLKNYWSSNKLPQSERFLRDYILNKGYADTKFADIPTYDEIVGDTAPLSDDEKELEKQAEFEHKYNFRYEEPDSEFIQRYPRTIENSVRRTDDKRKQKRQELKERKQQEKDQKMHELEIVKEMKRKEIEERIQKLKMVTGNDELGFKDEELEEDFDPEAHDRRMQELFNDEYYQVDEGEEKPECPSDIEELKYEDWDNYDPTKAAAVDGYVPHCEDDDFNMDCDYDPATAKDKLQKELIENTKSRKSRKGRRNRFMEMIQAEKPVFNPEDEKTYPEYIDEYYNIDCEDIIGDVACRFKYVETEPNDFGLTIEEILLAKNKELNQWASLKKAIQIRPDYVEKKEQRLYKLKAKNEDLKRKIFKSLYGEGSDEEEENTTEAQLQENKTGAPPEKTENLNKKKKRKAAAAASKDDMSPMQEEHSTQTPDSTAKKTKLEQANADELKRTALAEEKNVRADITASKKKKRKRKNKNQTNESLQTTTITPTTNAVVKTDKKPFGVKKELKHNPFIAKKSNQFKNASARQTGVLPPLRAGRGKTIGHKTKTNLNKFQGKGPKVYEKDNTNISDERLKAYGINPRKFHNKNKYGKPQD